MTIWSSLKTAARAMRRHAGYTSINVVGLATGIAVCLLITLYIRHELSYDRFHADADRIVRVVSDWGDFSVPATNPPMVRTLQTAWPDVPIATLFRVDGLVAHEATRFEEDDIFFANAAFFDVFSFALQRGSPATALERPFTAVITTDLARKYFGEADPVGQWRHRYWQACWRSKDRWLQARASNGAHRPGTQDRPPCLRASAGRVRSIPTQPANACPPPAHGAPRGAAVTFVCLDPANWCRT